MLDFTAAGMHGGLSAFTAVFIVFQLARDRLFVDTGFVVLHFAVLTREIDVGVLSAWHVN